MILKKGLIKIKPKEVLARDCWRIQKECELSDGEMVFLLNMLKSHYETNSEVDGEIDRDYLENLIKACFMVIGENFAEGDK